MLDIKSGRWVEITFIEGYADTKCSLSNILYGIMYRWDKIVQTITFRLATSTFTTSTVTRKVQLKSRVSFLADGHCF